MLVFVDESGDTGLKLEKGSSKFFTVTLVLFEDNDEALACDQRIQLLKRELGYREDCEFHFKTNSRRVRQKFFEAVAPYNFFYFAVVISKKGLWGPGFAYKESFYKYACSLVFENAKPYLSSAIVIIDKSGSRDFRAQLDRYLKIRTNQEKNQRFIKRVKMERSKSNNLIQLADMVSGAVVRSLDKGKKDRDLYRALIKHREIYVQIWPK